MLIQYNIIYKFIVERCIELNIDESHAVKHSMDVLKYSQKIVKFFTEKLVFVCFW